MANELKEIVIRLTGYTDNSDVVITRAERVANGKWSVELYFKKEVADKSAGEGNDNK